MLCWWWAAWSRARVDAEKQLMLWHLPPDSRCGGTLDPAHRQRSHTSRPFSLSQVFNQYVVFFSLGKRNESRIKKDEFCLTYQQVEVWWESLGVICLSCGCTNSHTIVVPAVIHPQFDNRNSCLSSLPKKCTSTQILISKSGGGTTDLIHLFNFPSFSIQSKIATVEKEFNCVCIIGVCVRCCLL